jgi:hypothetical protein
VNIRYDEGEVNPDYVMTVYHGTIDDGDDGQGDVNCDHVLNNADGVIHDMDYCHGNGDDNDRFNFNGN